jgi:Glycine rich protein
VVFQWTNNTPAIGLAAAGTGNIPSFIAQNPGTTPLVATITVTPVTGLATPVVTTYNFTGAVQTFTVPAGITSVNLKTWGAQGNRNAGGIAGGLGGYAEGNLAVTPGQVLNVFVGGGAATSINGGYNGGGAAGTNPGCAAAQGGGGGGASDVRIAPYALANRVIVGAGGGGAGGNRTAGCGRGSGGGGGGGLWGGGGGAGWPGVPPGGPVPTGGTQVAGGAGGVTTWTAGGPTNGNPGVLGVGGSGGGEIASAQGTPTGPAEQGGVGGGLTGGSGLYNSANNWNGHSGAGGSSYIGGVSGGLTTAGLRTGAGQVQVTYTPVSAATCFGTARTFTITVNPNAALIIVADPGTTLCEGDPTLLTVYDAGAVSAPATLYTQGTTPVNGAPSQVFEPANAAFDSQSADDFTIPSGGLWTITQVTANGIGTGTPTSVNVFFYNNAANLPGTAIASFTNITTFTRVGGNYTVTLPSSVSLGGGTYWMSFQVNMSFATGGQWFWGNFGAANVGNEYAFRNPGGGFATPCTNWGYGGTGCNVGGGPANRNIIFSVFGTSVGLGPQSTGTFLWSPAAGLSSTTSNPVAASPMNTTTYTVVRTTGAGCQRSAQVTITVNKRSNYTASQYSKMCRYCSHLYGWRHRHRPYLPMAGKYSRLRRWRNLDEPVQYSTIQWCKYSYTYR